MLYSISIDLISANASISNYLCKSIYYFFCSMTRKEQVSKPITIVRSQTRKIPIELFLDFVVLLRKLTLFWLQRQRDILSKKVLLCIGVTIIGLRCQNKINIRLGIKTKTSLKAIYISTEKKRKTFFMRNLS